MNKDELVVEIGNQFPKELVDNLEVKDIDGYKKYWLDWLKNSGGKRLKVKVVIKESALFIKMVAKEQDCEEFWKEVPVAPEKMVKRVLKQADGFKAVAVNSELYLPILEVVKELKGQVVGVYPEKEETSLIDSKINSHKLNLGKTAGVVSVLVFLVGGLYLGVNKIKNLNSNQTVEIKAVEVSPTPTQEPEKIQDIGKIKILVLNASGIAGKAKEIGEWLKEQGYSQVETGNTEVEYQGLIVTAGTNVQLTEQIITDLNQKYEAASGEMKLEDFPGFDVLIVYGN